MSISLLLKRLVHVPVQLLIILVATSLFGHLLSQSVQAFIYSISLTLNNFLLFLLPMIIFICLFTSLLDFKLEKGLKLILVLGVVIFISNYISTLIAYGVGSLKLIKMNTALEYIENNKVLLPLWEIGFPKWISNSTALCFGLVLGIFFSVFPNKFVSQFSIYSKQFVSFFLEKIFSRILPFFVLGYILKMQFEGIFLKSMQSCLALIVLITLTFILYLGFLFALVAKFSFKQWIFYIRNTLPVALTGFSTMSSLATLPVTISTAQKNIGSPYIGQFVIPISVNIHMIGLAINIPLMALTLLLNFGHEFPTFVLYNKFAINFVITQLAIAALPGCGVLVMIPLLEYYFGFTGEMSALIMTIYILFDAVETSANVVGNSILVIIISKVYNRFKLQSRNVQTV